MIRRLLIPVLIVLCGCEDEMSNQQRVKPFRPVPELGAGFAALSPVKNTISITAGLNELELRSKAVEQPAAIPIQVTMGTLEEGRTLYNIYCTPCHDKTGEGNGMVIKRGFPKPGSLIAGEVLGRSNGELFRAIDEGKGTMASQRPQLKPEQSWKVVAYMRVLQRAANSNVNELTQSEREQLHE